ncbi:MAG TPA: hypothetical protein VFA90_19380 [Terriglobales bacterium]|nr:hypothetical protein [Terriglobales bacterium]
MNSIQQREKNRLSVKLKYYAAHKREWLKGHRGEYVVVQDTRLLGFFGSWEEAFRSGVQAFGAGKDFLVKQVLAREPVYFVYCGLRQSSPCISSKVLL